MFASPWQIILIVVVIFILFFGAKRIPEIAGSIGKGIKEFKKAGDDKPEDPKGEGEEQNKDSGQPPPSP